MGHALIFWVCVVFERFMDLWISKLTFDIMYVILVLSGRKNEYEYCVNVLGGIDAWAALIDRNIRRY